MPTESEGGATAPAGDRPAAQDGPAARSNFNNGRGGRGGRGRRDRRDNRPSSRPGSDRARRTQFEGREPSLKGFIYDSTGERSPDQYIKTTKEIINYVGRTYTKYTAEFTQAVRDLQWLP
jgi:hypothetical protein